MSRRQDDGEARTAGALSMTGPHGTPERGDAMSGKAMTEQKRAESEVARTVVSYLSDLGFVTHEEVSTGYGGDRADIVAIRGPIVAVVEVKSSLSLVLLNQCLRWRGQAHWVIAASDRGRNSGAAHILCRHVGIGLWSAGFGSIHEIVPPRLDRRAVTTRLLARCVSENRTGSDYAKAGTSGGGYYTPFQRFARDVARIVKEQHARTGEGLTVRQVVEAVRDHHYSSDKVARSSLPGLLRRGVIAGVRADETGRGMVIFPNEATA